MPITEFLKRLVDMATLRTQGAADIVEDIPSPKAAGEPTARATDKRLSDKLNDCSFTSQWTSDSSFRSAVSRLRSADDTDTTADFESAGEEDPEVSNFDNSDPWFQSLEYYGGIKVKDSARTPDSPGQLDADITLRPNSTLSSPATAEDLSVLQVSSLGSSTPVKTPRSKSAVSPEKPSTVNITPVKTPRKKLSSFEKSHKSKDGLSDDRPYTDCDILPCDNPSNENFETFQNWSKSPSREEILSPIASSAPNSYITSRRSLTPKRDTVSYSKSEKENLSPLASKRDSIGEIKASQIDAKSKLKSSSLTEFNNSLVESVNRSDYKSDRNDRFNVDNLIDHLSDLKGKSISDLTTVSQVTLDEGSIDGQNRNQHSILEVAAATLGIENLTLNSNQNGLIDNLSELNFEGVSVPARETTSVTCSTDAPVSEVELKETTENDSVVEQHSVFHVDSFTGNKLNVSGSLDPENPAEINATVAEIVETCSLSDSCKAENVSISSVGTTDLTSQTGVNSAQSIIENYSSLDYQKVEYCNDFVEADSKQEAIDVEQLQFYSQNGSSVVEGSSLQTGGFVDVSSDNLDLRDVVLIQGDIEVENEVVVVAVNSSNNLNETSSNQLNDEPTCESLPISNVCVSSDVNEVEIDLNPTGIKSVAEEKIVQNGFDLFSETQTGFNCSDVDIPESVKPQEFVEKDLDFLGDFTQLKSEFSADSFFGVEPKSVGASQGWEAGSEKLIDLSISDSRYSFYLGHPTGINPCAEFKEIFGFRVTGNAEKTDAFNKTDAVKHEEEELNLTNAFSVLKIGAEQISDNHNLHSVLSSVPEIDENLGDTSNVIDSDDLLTDQANNRSDVFSLNGTGDKCIASNEAEQTSVIDTVAGQIPVIIVTETEQTSEESLGEETSCEEATNQSEVFKTDEGLVKEVQEGAVETVEVGKAEGSVATSDVPVVEFDGSTTDILTLKETNSCLEESLRTDDTEVYLKEVQTLSVSEVFVGLVGNAEIKALAPDSSESDENCPKHLEETELKSEVLLLNSVEDTVTDNITTSVFKSSALTEEIPIGSLKGSTAETLIKEYSQNLTKETESILETFSKSHGINEGVIKETESITESFNPSEKISHDPESIAITFGQSEEINQEVIKETESVAETFSQSEEIGQGVIKETESIHETISQSEEICGGVKKGTESIAAAFNPAEEINQGVIKETVIVPETFTLSKTEESSQDVRKGTESIFETLLFGKSKETPQKILKENESVAETLKSLLAKTVGIPGGVFNKAKTLLSSETEKNCQTTSEETKSGLVLSSAVKTDDTLELSIEEADITVKEKSDFSSVAPSSCRRLDMAEHEVSTLSEGSCQGSNAPSNKSIGMNSLIDGFDNMNMNYELSETLAVDDFIHRDDDCASDISSDPEYLHNMSEEDLVAFLDVESKRTKNHRPFSTSVKPSLQHVPLTTTKHLTTEMKPLDLNTTEAGPVTAGDDIQAGELSQVISDGDVDDISALKRKVDQNADNSLIKHFDPLTDLPPTTNHFNDSLFGSRDVEVEVTPIKEHHVGLLIPVTPLPDSTPKRSRATTTPDGVNSADLATTPSTSRNLAIHQEEVLSPVQIAITKELSKLQEASKERMRRHEARKKELLQKIAEAEKKRDRNSAILKKVSEKKPYIQKLEQAKLSNTKIKEEHLDVQEKSKELLYAFEIYEKKFRDVLNKNNMLSSLLEAECKSLLSERDSAQRHVANMETALNDTHTKYERSMKMVEDYEQNQMRMLDVLRGRSKDLSLAKANFNKLLMHASHRLEETNKARVMLQRSQATEIERTQALIDQKELKIKNNDFTIKQKEKELREIRKIYEDLISKLS